MAVAHGRQRQLLLGELLLKFIKVDGLGVLWVARGEGGPALICAPSVGVASTT
jgi:hypothetical protein